MLDISLPLIIIIMPGEFQFTVLTQLNSKNFKKLGCLQNLAQIFKHSLDQAHEQQNAVVKGKGGIITVKTVVCYAHQTSSTP